MSLLDMSFSASALILVIVITRALLLHKLPKQTFLVLWGVVLCRLLVPFEISSRFSIYSVVNTLTSRFSKTDFSINAFPAAQNSTAITEITATLPEATYANVSPFTVMWFIGMVVCALFLLVTHLRCRREYKTALPVDNEAVRLWQQEHLIRRVVQIRQSDRISAPLTYGIFRPVILLPKQTDWTDETQLQYILAHELVHIRRFDTLTKLVMATALFIHWINPFVWLMYVLSNRDIELSCDEAVVRSFGGNVKSAYARTLIGLEEKKNRFTPLVNNFSKNAIEERIVSIMKIKRTSPVGILAALVLVAGTITVFATNATNTAAINTPIASAGSGIENSSTDFTEYKEYGLAYNVQTNALTYNGMLVRYFEDFYPLEDGTQAGIYFFDKAGTVDVHAVRAMPIKNSDGSIDPAGKLMGLKQSSRKDFEFRDVSALLNPVQQEAITGNDPANVTNNTSSTQDSSVPVAYSSEGMMTPDELAELYSVYAPFGLTYDKEKDYLYYNGKLVRTFLDVLSSNGEALESGKFKGSIRQWSNLDDKGDVRIKAVRDYTKLNANGEGELTGIEVVK